MIKFKYVPLALAVSLALAACGEQSAPTETAQTTPPVAPAKAAFTLDETKLPALNVFKAEDVDASAPACVDFNKHINGKWLAANPVPADRTTWGSFETLQERSLAVQQQLVEHAAADANAAGIEKLIGDLFATGMDQAKIDAAGIEPIKPLLAEVDALTDATSIAAYLRRNHARGLPQVFAFGGESDFKDSSRVIGYAFQGGLGLPEKSYYTEETGDKKQKRDAYVAHVAKTLELAGVSADDAAKQAQAVLAIETRLANASLSPIELRNPANQYNFVTVADADKAAKNFPWAPYLEALGLKNVEGFSLSQPKFFAEFDAMLADVPVADWQAYFRFHTVDGAAPYLSAALEQQNFDFYSKTLRGQQEMRPRWKRVLGVVGDQAGEALGQLYVAVAFPPESKARMEKLVSNLREALKARLEKLEWMSADTKAKALEKWNTFMPKIGYPDKWRDWSGLTTNRDSYFANVLAASEFNYRYNLDKIGKPKDRTEWGMSPQTVNAYYNPLLNEIVFPAAILQPPFFNAEADDAMNYGAIGGVIGHEMLHGYDDQGSQFDAAGTFANWWSADDAKGFKERTARLVKQFDDYVAIDDLHVKGELTLGENIADLGGLTVAYDAMKRAQGENFTDPQVDGMSQDQRFFAAWATVWRRNFTPDELKLRLNVDPHAPAMFRAIGAPSNMDSFAAAYSCKSGDAMVREGDKRVAIW